MASPDDKCKHCGHPRYHHNSPSAYDYAKTGYSSGRAHKIVIHARTCCWTNPLCTCLEFKEP